MSIKPIVVFDFDGTIADSLQSLVSVANELADVYNFPRFGPHDVSKLRNMSFKEIVKMMGIKKYQIPKLASDIRSRLNNRANSLKPVSNIANTIQSLAKRGYSLGILTSNSKDNVMNFLNKYDLSYFDFIYSEDNLLGKSGALKKLKKRYGEIIYIGDETRDVEASKKAGVKVIAVTWGLNSKELLAKSDADHVVSDPGGLLTLLTSK